MQQNLRYRLSVIIPAYNKRPALAETLGALERQGAPTGYEVIVVDDGSTDGTAEMLEAYRPTFPFRCLVQSNLGAAAARNAGVAASAGDVVLFLDADIMAAPGLIAAHLSFHETENAAMMVGRILPPNGAPAAYLVFGRSFDLGSEPRLAAPGMGLTGQLSVHKADFERIGGFRTAWPRAEDVEFSRRAAASGLRIMYCPNAVGYHNHVLSLSQLVRKEFDNHAGLVPYLAAQPDALKDFPYLREQWPPAWGVDPPALLLRKLGRAALASRPARDVLYAVCALAERFWPSPVVMDFLVWKLLGAYQWLGLREGMHVIGWRPDAAP